MNMTALTICQPYAHLICLPDDDDRAKRVENRRWGTSYRGPLLIHAGKSREWLDLDEDDTCDDTYEIPLSEMAFGAIVGIANLADCVQLVPVISQRGFLSYNVPNHASRRWPWLACHAHTEGPFCFVLTECRRFKNPIPCRGARGLFSVPREVVSEAIELLKEPKQ